MPIVLIVVLIVLGLLIIALAPLAAIWSVNTLFGLGIAYSVKTWFAALILSSILGGRINQGNRKG